MSALGRESIALLSAARDGLSPDALAIERVRAKLAAQIAAPIVAGATPAAAAPAAAAPASAAADGVASAGKIAALAALGAVAVGSVTAVVVQRRAPMPASPPPALVVQHPPAPPPALVVRPTPASPPPPPAVVVQPAPPAALPPPPVHVSVPRPVTGPKSPPAGPSLAREVELLGGASAALRAKHYTLALDAIETYTRETAGHGQLAEEAAAIEVEASCKSDSPSSATLLVEFDRRWPHSAERTRLTAACKP